MAKILITGGAGFIGSAVIRLAIQRGHQVINFDALTYAACLDNLAAVCKHQNYVFEKGDVRDRNCIDALIERYSPDALMHFAAESHVDRSIDGPGDFITTNILGTYNLLESVRSYWNSERCSENFRFLHISTDEVFGSLGTEGFFNEETPYSPRSPYSASKASSDHLVRAWHHTYGIPILITNCSNNYGPYQFPEKLIPLSIINAILLKPITIYGDGQNVRDWLHVDDHANALLMVLDRGRIGQSYNIGGDNEAKNIDLVHRLCGSLNKKRVSDRPYEELITFVKDRLGHDYRYAIDASCIKKEIGWRPVFSLNEGLDKTVDWYLENETWWSRLYNCN